MREIVDELRERGELDETAIVYLSDNGFSFGEHRWFRKTCPYDECIRVPLLIRLPGVQHRTEPAMVSAVDLAPTIAELAGVEPPGGLDGTSLVPLLREGSRSGLSGEVFAEWVGDDGVPPWRELRTRRWAYVELATGERELYDLRRDPYQLVNVAADPAYGAEVQQLSAALAAYGGP
jgi:arylsulfatase A-like enzyme